jgi:hypothetical protein
MMNWKKFGKKRSCPDRGVLPAYGWRESKFEKKSIS